MPTTLELDAVTVKALAHPLRVQIMRILELRSRASVTSLADELGETTGATSYHLRQLARHGFVRQCEPAPAPPAPAGAGTAGRRQKWWCMAVDQIHLTGFDLFTDDDTREAVQLLSREIQADRSRRSAHWIATATEWSLPWQLASSDSDGVLELDAAQTRALADEIKALIARYDAMTPGVSARRVDVQYAINPAEDGTRA